MQTPHGCLPCHVLLEDAEGDAEQSGIFHSPGGFLQLCMAGEKAEGRDGHSKA